ncbi:glycosyltransferase family 2 protein [Leucobacter viscericola]|uniref:Glycosyltransferase family 2 protein n=1 Tax=Leucobacter viscericola TaxID=2714935 RepID=A0A6G7XER4_9MICO|nr:glycosyltransferase family 2 protein [Leucobacter viscericola]QIK63002.1 glycosyltransferase family 2 protein [Leucobacter viscericola]
MTFPLERVLIVMPAFNEEEVIASVVREVRQTLPGATVLVVNDGSSDATTDRAREAGARVLELPFNLGVGGAMRLGFRYAETNGFPVAVQLDSDGQHNPADVPALVALLDASEGSNGAEGVDVVVGARFTDGDEYEVRGPRKWAMRFLSSVLSRAMHVRLSDTTSGFKAHGPRAIHLFAREYPAEYLGDTIEALVIGHRAGLRFAQLGVTMRERAGGTPSHNPLKSAIYLGRAFFALVIAFLRPRPKTGVEL